MTDGAPRIALSTVVLDCHDAHELARFYLRLLPEWRVRGEEPDWVLIRSGDGAIGLALQAEPGYRPPVWPERGQEQQKMLHLDLRVDDLEAATAYAVDAGAVLAGYQPQDDVRVFFDPAGHPFCLFAD